MFYGSGKRSRGFRVLRNSLFLSCIQDIAKLTADSDERTPSVSKFVKALSEPALLATLRERYAKRVTPLAEAETDPEILSALTRLDAQEETERRLEFDDHYASLVAWWAQYESDGAVAACRIIRDKVTAHTEVRFVLDRYTTVDMSALGLKWSDVGKVTLLLQVPVAAIGHLVRCTSFAWDMLEEQLSRAANDFWILNDQAA